MSIGIGKSIELIDLVTLASDDTGVFLAETFEALDEIVTDVREGKCPGEIVMISCLFHDRMIAHRRTSLTPPPSLSHVLIVRKPHQPQLIFIQVLYPDWNLGILVFVEGGKLDNT